MPKDRLSYHIKRVRRFAKDLAPYRVAELERLVISAYTAGQRDMRNKLRGEEDEFIHG